MIRKSISIFLSALLVFSLTASFANAEQKSPDLFPPVLDSIKITDIHLRDPFVLTYEGNHYLYGTGAVGSGYGYYFSEDMNTWSGPYSCFTPDENFDGNGCYWAPECFNYNGSFYLFATYKSSATNHRGVGIFKADSPRGPFALVSDGHITPDDWDSIDGTLYVDASGQPWMIFVHEWTSTSDGIGRMCISKLSSDLTSFTTQPVEIFRANDAAWGKSNKVTDGPFVYTTSNNKLLMLWSGMSVEGYCVGIATPGNADDITAPWVQQSEPFIQKGEYFGADGGHAMIFTDVWSRDIIAFHSSNKAPDERVVFAEIIDTGDSIKLKAVQDTEDHYDDGLNTLKDNLLNIITTFFKKLPSPLWELVKGIAVGLFNSIKSLF